MYIILIIIPNVEKNKAMNSYAYYKIEQYFSIIYTFIAVISNIQWYTYLLYIKQNDCKKIKQVDM